MKTPLLAALLATLAGPALAQAPAPAAQMNGAPAVALPMNATPMNTMPAAKPGPFAAMAEKRIADLHAKLGVTPAQEGVWTDFTATMRGNAAAVDALGDHKANLEAETALQSMQRYAAFTQANAEAMQRLLPKFQALYAALTPAQQKKADDVFAQYRRKLMRRN